MTFDLVPGWSHLMFLPIVGMLLGFCAGYLKLGWGHVIVIATVLALLN
jgi:hypothetical protein